MLLLIILKLIKFLPLLYNISFFAFLHCAFGYSGDNFYTYSLQGSCQVADWCKAMDAELRALEENNTWEITTLPKDKKAIACHWICKTKLKSDGSLDRKIAWALLAVAAMNDALRLCWSGEHVQDTTSSTLVCKLKKSLYGLKQAPRQWFAKLSSALLSFGYIQSKAGYSLFTKSDNSSFTAADMGNPLPDPEVYRRYIGKIIYLTITRPDICYIVQLLSQFMQNPTSVHMRAVKHLLRYLLNAPGQAEAEYKAMALTCCKVTWLVSLLKDFGLKDFGPVDLKCDNKEAIYIADNPVFHARTKHIEIDCHYVRDQVKRREVLPSYVPTKSQLANVFTKVLSVDQHNQLLSKLGVTKSCPSLLKGECKRDKG
ncbi:cysteine-rich receptor-like protein kinase 8 [Tanacetum coccineum]